MSFTEDELQAFHSILEQRFIAHRQEMEQALDQRFNAFRQEVDQHLAALRQEITDDLKQDFIEERNKLEVFITRKLAGNQAWTAQTFTQEIARRQEHTETAIDRLLAAQLLGIEQLLTRQESLRSLEVRTLVQNMRPQLETIELQTELPWEDMAEAMGKALDGRLASLHTSIQQVTANLEQYLAVHLHGLRDEIAHSQGNGQVYNASLGSMSSLSEILEGIAHLERIIESMQVAMTANHALLSNRLYHHQQLPLERAHPVGFSQVEQQEPESLLVHTEERLTGAAEPIVSGRQSEVGETEGD